jgi:hypothetical protein
VQIVQGRSLRFEVSKILTKTANFSFDAKQNIVGLFTKPNVMLLLAFLLPALVRAVPEILMGPFVTGFDVLAYYIPNTLLWLKNGVGFWNLLAVAPFFYLLLMGITSVGVPIVLSLKIVSPLLLGFLGITVYSYANKALLWSPKKSLVVTLFATLYIVALRVSWDMLRTELGLIFLFAALLLLEEKDRSGKNWVFLTLAMLAVAFAHQLVSFIMFSVVLFTTVLLSIERKWGDVRRIVFCSFPAIFLFSSIIYANYAVASDFSALSGFPAQTSEGWMSLFGFATYTGFVIDTLGFLFLCYLPILPLLILGFKRFGKNLQLKAWILCILLIVLLSIITANTFFGVLPYRWIILLTFPLAFYAATGFSRLRKKKYQVAIGFVLIALSASFAVLPRSLALPYFSVFPYYGTTSLLNNTVPLSDCQDTVAALGWASNEMNETSCLLVHDAFYGWAILDVGDDKLLPYGHENPVTIAKELIENGSRHQLFLIWWIDEIEWYNQSPVTPSFEQLYRSGNIAIYAYNTTIT